VTPLGPSAPVDRAADLAGATLAGPSRAIRELYALAARVATGDAKVLITGESGVGKDVLARYIHEHSRRAARPLVTVNSAGVTETLLESELFGHVRGSFTGAYRDKPGKLQLAHRATIFLDEVGDMSLRMQALLLRFLENGEIQPVGSDGATSRADVRVITATNRDLPELVGSGRFREDLLYRIKVVHLHVPPLRERPEDIRPLVARILARARRQLSFSDDAWRALEASRWTGNVRELQNVVEQLVWMTPRDLVEVEDLPPSVRAPALGRVLPGRERRRQISDCLYEALTSGRYRFWEHIHGLFLDRDLTRHDLRSLVRRGLMVTHGSYRALLELFGMEPQDYKRFMNFLAAHDCTVDFREFRLSQGNQPADALPFDRAAS
jgi:DNA-binding NtrC family response regulator